MITEAQREARSPIASARERARRMIIVSCASIPLNVWNAQNSIAESGFASQSSMVYMGATALAITGGIAEVMRYRRLDRWMTGEGGHTEEFVETASIPITVHEDNGAFTHNYALPTPELPVHTPPSDMVA